jgi:hypothetical protein
MDDIDSPTARVSKSLTISTQRILTKVCSDSKGIQKAPSAVSTPSRSLLLHKNNLMSKFERVKENNYIESLEQKLAQQDELTTQAEL